MQSSFVYAKSAYIISIYLSEYNGGQGQTQYLFCWRTLDQRMQEELNIVWMKPGNLFL